MEIVQDITTILGLVITVSGAVFALWIFLRDKRMDTIRLLAKQIIAYNRLEQELLKEISAKTGKPVQTLQKEFRQKALNDQDDISSFMTPSKAKNYLSIV